MASGKPEQPTVRVGPIWGNLAGQRIAISDRWGDVVGSETVGSRCGPIAAHVTGVFSMRRSERR